MPEWRRRGRRHRHNPDLLFDEEHLGAPDTDDRQSVVKSFLKVALMAVTGGRKNSMNAATLPVAEVSCRKDTIASAVLLADWLLPSRNCEPGYFHYPTPYPASTDLDCFAMPQLACLVLG